MLQGSSITLVAPRHSRVFYARRAEFFISCFKFFGSIKPLYEIVIKDFV